jgi:ATP-dependent exoDNAse (exonuclease V) beta subunit
MSKTLSEILAEREKKKLATARGTAAHAQLQHIVLGRDGQGDKGDAELIAKIRTHPEIAKFFTPGPELQIRTEVPIAGIINNRFASRRIDRLIVGENTVEFIDYKTDTDRTMLRDKYAAQMREYAALLSAVYPGCTVRGFILWLHDWELEEIS